MAMIKSLSPSRVASASQEAFIAHARIKSNTHLELFFLSNPVKSTMTIGNVGTPTISIIRLIINVYSPGGLPLIHAILLFQEPGSSKACLLGNQRRAQSSTKAAAFVESAEAPAETIQRCSWGHCG